MKKKICLILIIFMMIIGISGVKAEVIGVEISAGDGGIASSDTCGTSLCMKPISFYGIAVTIIDSNGNVVKDRKNIWNNTSARDFVKKYGNSNDRQDISRYDGTLPNSYQGSTKCTTRYLFKNMSDNNNNYSKAALFDTDQKPYIYDYSSFINSLDVTDIGYILEKFSMTVDQAVNYYIKIEPIYVLQEQFFDNGVCNYFVGTSSEILKFATKENYTEKNLTALYYFARGGKNSIVNGNWNVIRNRIVNPYYSCNNKISGLSGVSCYNGTLNKNSYANGNNVDEMHNLYKNGNGLGVGYVRVKDYLSSLTIVKKDEKGYILKGEAQFALYEGEKCDGTPLSQGSTNSDGEITFSGLHLNNVYSYKEIKAPNGYKQDTNCYVIKLRNTSHMRTVINFKENAKKYLNITKIDENGDPISGVKFMLCNSQNEKCSSSSTNSNGIVRFELDGSTGQPKLYEKVKKGYSTTWDGTSCVGCAVTTLSFPSDIKGYDFLFYIQNAKEDQNVIIENIKNCASEFESKKVNGNVSIDDRINMYLNDYPNYNNLLNTSITNGAQACSYKPCSLSSSAECMIGNVKENRESQFYYWDSDAADFSCYNDVITNNSGLTVGLCSTEFSIDQTWQISPGKLDSDENPISSFSAKRGQMFFRSKINSMAMTGQLTKSCYIWDKSNGINHALSFDDYVADVSLIYDNINAVTPYNSDDISWESHEDEGYSVYTSSRRYDFFEIYSHIGTGTMSYDNCDDCKSLGYGILSDRSDKNASGNMSFTYTLVLPKVNSAYSEKTYYASGTCPYTLKDELYNPKLNIEFRVIDTLNPFPGIVGTGRKTSTNWCGEDKDSNIDCSNKNNIVTEYITNRNNSYGSNALYTIELSPSDIKKIREYNKTTTYDDVNFEYEGKYGYIHNSYSICNSYSEEDHPCIIKSKFLNGLRNGSISSDNKTWYLDNTLNG